MKIVLFLFACIALIRSGGSTLPSISMKDISSHVIHGCAVALLPTTDSKLQGILDEINQNFEAGRQPSVTPTDKAEFDINASVRNTVSASTASRSPLVKIGLVSEEFMWSDSNYVKISNVRDGIIYERGFVVFPQVKLDRSCLISSPKSQPKADAYFGPYVKQTVLEFINMKCNTYLDVNGGLDSKGLHREDILRKMFRMQEVPSVTMKYVHSKTMKNKIHANGSCNTNNIKTEWEFHDSEGEVVSDESSHFPECADSREGSFGDEMQAGMSPHVQNYWGHELTKTPPSDEDAIPKCERIFNPTKEEFFNEYLKRSRPVIIVNGAAHWPAFTRWTKEFLRRSYGEKQVHIKLAPDGIFEGVEPAALWEDYEEFSIPLDVVEKLLYPDLVVVRPATQNLPFSAFLDLIHNSTNSWSIKGIDKERSSRAPRVSAYLEYSSILTYFPELESDVIEPDFMHGLLDRQHLNIWLSDGNTLGKLHFDPFDNFLCQLRGRKELILFEPHNNVQLYEAHIPEALLGFDPASHRFRRKKLMDSTSMVMSPVDIQDPDFERFPAFADARPLNCTINEGDILFMPAFWWHEVQSYPNEIEGRNLAVNFWYEPFLTKEFPCADCPLEVNPYYRHLL